MSHVPDVYQVMDGSCARAGDEAQRLTEMFRTCYAPVLAFARRRVGDDLAQDVVAETFLMAWRSLDSVPVPPLPWLYRTAGYAIANQRRSLARRGRLDARARNMIGCPSAPDHAELVASAQDLESALRALGERDQHVLRLVAQAELTCSGAAAVLGCSTGTFKVRLYRARRRLSGQLERGDRGACPVIFSTIDSA
jgi:RNA polymerase sigma-70 factor, ECF subfamily